MFLNTVFHPQHLSGVGVRRWRRRFGEVVGHDEEIRPCRQDAPKVSQMFRKDFLTYITLAAKSNMVWSKHLKFHVFRKLAKLYFAIGFYFMIFCICSVI